MQSLLEKKAKQASENPFYKMRSLLSMFTQLPKASDSITKQQVFNYLTTAWAECTDKVKREAFFTIFFSIGDVQNREHNIFKAKGITNVDGGGHSKRKVFTYCLDWLLTNLPNQFYRFMPILGEYYNLDVFRMYSLTTDRKTGQIKEVNKLNLDVDKVTEYISALLRNVRTSDNEKKLWARWLPHVPTSKRIRKYEITEKNIKAFQKNGHTVKIGDVVTVKKDKQNETNSKDSWVNTFIAKLSEKMNWLVVKHAKNSEFRGYRAFRKKFLVDSEAALFSSKRIQEMDETQILGWFDTLPNGARHRVACRLVYKDAQGNYVSKGKWTNKYGVDIAAVYVKWLGLKATAQQQLRELTDEKKATMTTTEIKQLEKTAKVNVGADSVLDAIVEAMNTTTQQEMDVKIDSVLRKINIEVPVRVCVDISGSMRNNSILHKGVRFTSSQMARLATTVFLLRSPEEELSEAFIRFDSTADFVCAGERLEKAGANKFMATSVTEVTQLIDKTKPFSWNLANVSQYVISRGATHLTAITDSLKTWVKSTPGFENQRIEAINKYPVWLVISDGDINNGYNAKESVLQFQADMRQYFGWDGILVLWDIKEESQLRKGTFEGLNNFIHLPGCNPAVVNQIFKNLHDLDVVDEYLPLKALHESNRYLPVRELVM